MYQEGEYIRPPNAVGLTYGGGGGQIGMAKVHYGNGRKIHTCSRCGAPNRRMNHATQQLSADSMGRLASTIACIATFSVSQLAALRPRIAHAVLGRIKPPMQRMRRPHPSRAAWKRPSSWVLSRRSHSMDRSREGSEHGRNSTWC